MRIRFYKDIFCLLLFFAFVFLTISCGRSKGEKVPVEFEVCNETQLPDELKDLIEEKKESEFQLTYENSQYLYLAVGYGRQPQGEYVAAVKEIYEEEEGIVADMILISLTYAQERETGAPSVCPYIVLRCEKTEKPVFFR